MAAQGRGGVLQGYNCLSSQRDRPRVVHEKLFRIIFYERKMKVRSLKKWPNFLCISVVKE